METLKYGRTKFNMLSNKEISTLFGIILAIVICFLGCFNKSEDISKNVLRLHIIANSNRKEDQELKLIVRDAILKNFNFSNYEKNLEECKKQVEKEIPNIESVAKNEIKKQGLNYDVKAELKNIYFNTREYNGFSMPAGFYDAVTIKLGTAKGKNWWCVFVPPLCLTVANRKKEDAFQTFNCEEKDLVKKGYKTEVRFAIIECFKNLFF